MRNRSGNTGSPVHHNGSTGTRPIPQLPRPTPLVALGSHRSFVSKVRADMAKTPQREDETFGYKDGLGGGSSSGGDDGRVDRRWAMGWADNGDEDTKVPSRRMYDVEDVAMAADMDNALVFEELRLAVERFHAILGERSELMKEEMNRLLDARRDEMILEFELNLHEQADEADAVQRELRDEISRLERSLNMVKLELKIKGEHMSVQTELITAKDACIEQQQAEVAELTVELIATQENIQSYEKLLAEVREAKKRESSSSEVAAIEVLRLKEVEALQDEIQRLSRAQRHAEERAELSATAWRDSEAMLQQTQHELNVWKEDVAGKGKALGLIKSNEGTESSFVGSSETTGLPANRGLGLGVLDIKSSAGEVVLQGSHRQPGTCPDVSESGGFENEKDENGTPSLVVVERIRNGPSFVVVKGTSNGENGGEVRGTGEKEGGRVTAVEERGKVDYIKKREEREESKESKEMEASKAEALKLVEETLLELERKRALEFERSLGCRVRVTCHLGFKAC